MKGIKRMIVGLGNPGGEYVGTRHNVGFEVLDRLIAEGNSFFESSKVLEGYTGPRQFTVALQRARQAGAAVRDIGHDEAALADVLCVKPATFMNRSGIVVAPIARWAELTPEEILVIVDDLDLPFGVLRIRPHGGTGGHNGLRSLVDCLDSNRFPRLRVGIGRSGTDAARHVLECFGQKEREQMDVVVAQAAEAVCFWAEGGNIEECMTRFHSRWNQALP